MAEVGREAFRRQLAKCELVALDSNVLIYHLEALEPYVRLTTTLIALLAEGALGAVVSTLSLAELLVGPYRAGDEANVRLAREFVESLPGTLVAHLDAPLADASARVRARGPRMPDAIVMATAIVHEADALVTNDPGLRHRIEGMPDVILLEDYCRS